MPKQKEAHILWGENTMSSKNFLALVTWLVTIGLLIAMFIYQETTYGVGNIGQINYSIDYQTETIHLRWDPVKNADGYEVYISEDKKSYILIGNVDENQADIKSEFAIGSTYRIKVRPYADGNETTYGKYSDPIKLVYKEYELT